MRATLKRFCKDEQGATTIEYVLIIVIVSVGIIGAAQGITVALDGMLTDTASRL